MYDVSSKYRNPVKKSLSSESCGLLLFSEPAGAAEVSLRRI